MRGLHQVTQSNDTFESRDRHYRWYRSPTRRAVILMIMYVEMFKTGVIVFVSAVKMCLMLVILTECQIQTYLIFLWTKVSSVIQILSAAHIKRDMSRLSIIGYRIPQAYISICYGDKTKKKKKKKKKKKTMLGSQVLLRNLTIKIFQYPFNDIEINFLHVLLTRIDYFMSQRKNIDLIV